VQLLSRKNPIEPLAPPRSSLRLLHLCTVLAWVAWGLSLGLLWAQHRLHVLHPLALVFLVLLAATVLAALCGLANALWRVGKGPQWRVAAALGLVCLTPLGLWAALGLYLVSLARTSNFPKNELTAVASMGIASLMQAQAQYCYPHRLESERLVMSYDDRVTQPSRDLEAMDKHVAKLEALIGAPLRERIFWVRGEALRQQRMQFAGLVLGSSRSPKDWETADHPDRLSVDRHELAHAVIYQLQPSGTDAPTLLIEGWAEAQAGMTTQKLAESAKQSRAFWRERTGAGPEQSYLRELTGPSWYHQIGGPVYSVGGAFAEFLIHKYGVQRFLGLYFACRPGRFEAECPVQLGVEFDTLETEFWQEVDRLAGNSAATNQE
jgi:hypothetical protein